MKKMKLSKEPKEAPKKETNESLDPMEEATPNLKKTKIWKKSYKRC